MDNLAPPKKPRFKQPVEAASNPAALLYRETVQALVGMGRSKLYAEIRAKKFPAPVKLGYCSRWKAGDVIAWLEAQA
jgi:predicted DNA-binding transcriptional regulator AlpA